MHLTELSNLKIKSQFSNPKSFKFQTIFLLLILVPSFKPYAPGGHYNGPSLAISILSWKFPLSSLFGCCNQQPATGHGP